MSDFDATKQQALKLGVYKMTKIPFFFFLLTTLFSSSSSDADQRLHSRHLLHQPFFPVITAAPPPYQPPSSSSEPPSPSPHTHHHKKHPPTTQPPPPPNEKHLFSSVATPPPSPPHPNSFFPSSDPSSTVTHPPPPPPPSSLRTFPANISALLFPTQNTNPKPHKTRHIAKLITITASVISAASLLSLFAVFIIFLRRTRRHHRRRSSPALDTKSTRSDSLQLFTGAPSDKQPPKYASSHTSSEFLYLGTLVNSRSTGLDNQKSPVNVTGVLELPAPPPAASSSSSSYSQYHKLGSPELRPLPPLPKLPTFSPIYQSREQLNPKRHDFDGDDNENENDEFYSPRGSSGRKQSLKDSDLDQSNSVSSLNGSPVISLRPSSVSPCLNDGVSSRPVPTRPPPPPPPQPRLSEIPATMSISPPSGDSDQEKKPKLKALHWDKVRASSSRVMVWDQIKGNSFQ